MSNRHPMSRYYSASMELFKSEKRTAGAEKDLEKISEVLKAGFETLVIHGDIRQEKEEIILQLHPDLDAMAGVFLMDLAGVNYKALRFVPKGQEVAGAIHIDTGGRPELTFEEDGSIFFDHHGAAKKEPTSAAAIVYESLAKIGLLKKEAWLDKFTGFVTEVDNLSYPLNRRFFQNEWPKSLYGIHKELAFLELTELFKQGRDPKQPFTAEELENKSVKDRHGKQTKLSEISRRQKRLVDISVDGMVKAAKQRSELGIKIDTPELGLALVNFLSEVTDKKTGAQKQINKIPLGFIAVKAFGLDTYVLISEGSKSFFITSQNKDVPRIYGRVSTKFPGTQLIRGTMIIQPPGQIAAERFSSDDLLKVLDLKS